MMVEVGSKYTGIVKGQVDYSRSCKEYFTIIEENGLSMWSREFYVSEEEETKKVIDIFDSNKG